SGALLSFPRLVDPSVVPLDTVGVPGPVAVPGPIAGAGLPGLIWRAVAFSPGADGVGRVPQLLAAQSAHVHDPRSPMIRALRARASSGSNRFLFRVAGAKRNAVLRPTTTSIGSGALLSFPRCDHSRATLLVQWRADVALGCACALD